MRPYDWNEELEPDLHVTLPEWFIFTGTAITCVAAWIAVVFAGYVLVLATTALAAAI